MNTGCRISISAKLKWISCAFIAAFGVVISGAQLWHIIASWTAVGFFDAWPLWDRLMKFREGSISLDHYFFDPHGLHLHFIVYFLYWIDVIWGTGRQIVPLWATVISIVGVAAVLVFVLGHAARPKRLSDLFNLNFCALLFGTIMLVSGISEATLIPFQCVVIVTRFAQIFLLATLVWCHFRPHSRLYLAALIGSCVVVSFYGAGAVFASVIILLHVVFFRSWLRLLCSALPLVVYFLLALRYVRTSPEAVASIAVIRELDPATIAAIVKSAVCYYATAFQLGWPKPVQATFRGSEMLLVAVGALVCATTVIWAVRTLISLFLKSRARPPRIEPFDYAACTMALLSMLVFVSSLSAGLLWVVRARLLGPALGMPAYVAVLVATRYAPIASIAVVVFLFIFAGKHRAAPGTAISLLVFALTGVCAINAFGRPERIPGDRGNLEFAATALMMGLTPADDEAASAVWPGVRSESYWQTELPKIAAYLQSAGKSYAYRMPAVGQFSGGLTVRINDYTVVPVAENSKIGRLTGRVATFDTEGLIAPQRFFPITTIHNEVVGYAVRDGNAVRGHLLRLLPGGTAWVFAEIAQTRAVDFSDANWRKGIGTASKGMVLLAAMANANKIFTRGQKIAFARSGTRNIVQVGKEINSTVAIEIDGPGLDPEGDGYPNLIRLGREEAGDKPPLFLPRPQ